MGREGEGDRGRKMEDNKDSVKENEMDRRKEEMDDMGKGKERGREKMEGGRNEGWMRGKKERGRNKERKRMMEKQILDILTA